MSASQPIRPPSGSVVAGQYRVERLLGAGALGSVYLATRLADGRPVALKFLHDAARSHGGRFQREADVIASLKHPGIVKMLDFGEEQALGARFLAMEYLDGEPLSALVSRGPIAWPFALHLSWWLASALAEAHESGIVHRDLKPDNVVLQTYPHEVRPVMIDFGLARAEDERYESLTAEGSLLGTPAYMSPEQARNAAVGPSTDIYAVGTMLFEMLTGHLPFPSTGGIGGLMLKMRNPAPKLSEALPPGSDVPPAVEALVADLLVTDPAERLGSARELAARISQILDVGADRFTLDDQHDATLRHWLAPSSERPNPPVRLSRTEATPPAGLTSWLGIVAALVATGLIVFGLLSLLDKDDAAPAPPIVELPPRPVTSPVASVDPDPDPIVAPDVGRTTTDASSPQPVDGGPVMAALPPVPSAGCGNPLEPDTHTITTPFRDRELTSLVWLPPNYDAAVPHRAVIIIHSRERPALYVLEHRNFKPIAERERLVLIAPDDTSRGKLGGGDIEAIPAAVKQAGRMACLDLQWVYALGVARGEEFVRRLPNYMPLSATGGGIYRLKEGHAKDIGPVVPHIHLAGVHSREIPHEGGLNLFFNDEPVGSFEQDVQFWRRKHGCSDIAEDYPHHGPHGTCQTWECSTPFVACEVDGGRTWIGEPQEILFSLESEPTRFDHAEAIWTFFVRHGRPIPVER